MSDFLNLNHIFCKKSYLNHIDYLNQTTIMGMVSCVQWVML